MLWMRRGNFVRRRPRSYQIPTLIFIVAIRFSWAITVDSIEYHSSPVLLLIMLSRYIIPLVLLRLSLSTIAQQPCYWPDGSSPRPSQGPILNCYPAQDSVCCADGDLCLSNGLCLGSFAGMVRQLYFLFCFFTPLIFSSFS